MLNYESASLRNETLWRHQKQAICSVFRAAECSGTPLPELTIHFLGTDLSARSVELVGGGSGWRFTLPFLCFYLLPIIPPHSLIIRYSPSSPYPFILSFFLFHYIHLYLLFVIFLHFISSLYTKYSSIFHLFAFLIPINSTSKSLICILNFTHVSFLLTLLALDGE